MKTKITILSALFVLVATTFASAGSLTGMAKYDGEVPKFKEIKMDADPVCLTHHTGPVYPQTLVLGEGNTLGNVFVYIKSGVEKKAYPPPAEPVVLDQKGCEYQPHVAGIMVGQTMKILNPDGTLHNVHAVSKVNPEFNLAMPKFRTETTKVFDKPEFMFAMKCDVHPWMGAWITVMEHPFFAVTQTDGKFTIPNLPAGKYEAEAWHEKLGKKTFQFEITGDEAVNTDFVFAKPAAANKE